MKTDQIPSDTFAAKLTNEELEHLEAALDDPKKIGLLRITCQLEQIRRGGRKVDRKKPDKKTLAQSGADLKKHLHDLSDRRELFIYDIARHGSAKRNEIDGETFRDAILAIGGANPGFKNEIEERLYALDAAFFDTVLRVIKIVRSAQGKARFQGAIGMEVFSSHVFHAIRVKASIRKDDMPLPDSFTMRMIVSSWMGNDAYYDFKDWRSVWKAAGIRLKHPNTGRGKASTDRKYERFTKGRSFPSVNDCL